MTKIEKDEDLSSYKYFKNSKCEYFPCHEVEDDSVFSCLMCFCPLYHLEDCGGNFSILENGRKDCSKCIIPHTSYGYDYIILKLTEKT